MYEKAKQTTGIMHSYQENSVVHHTDFINISIYKISISILRVSRHISCRSLLLLLLSDAEFEQSHEDQFLPDMVLNSKTKEQLLLRHSWVTFSTGAWSHESESALERQSWQERTSTWLQSPLQNNLILCLLTPNVTKKNSSRKPRYIFFFLLI